MISLISQIFWPCADSSFGDLGTEAHPATFQPSQVVLWTSCYSWSLCAALTVCTGLLVPTLQMLPQSVTKPVLRADSPISLCRRIWLKNLLSQLDKGALGMRLW